MKEINYKDMKFNPFNLIGGEWMLVTAGNEQTGCNTMTASWDIWDAYGGTMTPRQSFISVRRDIRRNSLMRSLISRSA